MQEYRASCVVDHPGWFRIWARDKDIEAGPLLEYIRAHYRRTAPERGGY
jgi:hypothetical protein